MAHTVIQIQSYLFIISQPKVSFQFLICKESSYMVLLHTIIFIQSHILRLQMGSTTFKLIIFLIRCNYSLNSIWSMLSLISFSNLMVDIIPILSRCTRAQMTPACSWFSCVRPTTNPSQSHPLVTRCLFASSPMVRSMVEGSTPHTKQILMVSMVITPLP